MPSSPEPGIGSVQLMCERRGTAVDFGSPASNVNLTGEKADAVCVYACMCV